MSDDEPQDIYVADTTEGGEVEEKAELEDGFDDDDSDHKDDE